MKNGLNRTYSCAATFTLTAALGVVLCTPLASASDKHQAQELEETHEEIMIGGQAVTPKRIGEAPMEGWDEVVLPSGEIFYTDSERRYLILGTLYENADDRLVNVTEILRRQERIEALTDLRDSFITFQASNEEIGEITVFTDTSCSYCGMLHGDIDAINAAGITVNYLPFPRMGLNNPVAQQLSEIWCSETPHKELSTAFNPGLAVENDGQAWDRCGETVASAYSLGHSFGVEGTPAIVLPNGEMGEGYMPVEHLVHAVMSSGS
ncbi:thioredoxin fold domain-containing protein [Vreelandella nigrificans]|uniref:Thiol:disulfide interchange protein n=1 Tax=Vreelandella nigrificans TaxID=2042704 RepID=A0A2A4HIR5_9GAMM|nr:thioredoxin fold domain-containing protein [Halomonas nigrificans]PCF94085.1 protein-disulfide isomerase [Halomonas nigrificans]